VAYRGLGLPDGLVVTRRWFDLIPASGEPVKLDHRIEAGHLDSLPGTKHLYSGWQGLFEQVKAMLANHRDIAMQYSPNNLIFYVSLVDGGTLDLIRGLGKNVVSSGDLVAQFEATWSEEQIKSHFAARDAIDSITPAAFQEIGRRARNGVTTEHEMQQWFMQAFQRENLVTDDPPIVAVNANSGNPHYEPSAGNSARIREGDFVLLDVWAKKNTPGAVYYDITWTGFVGKAPSEKMREVFNVVRQGRDIGVNTVQQAVSAGRAEVSQPITNMSVIVPAVACLIPGAGHLIQQRWIRGVLLMVSIVTMFVLGLLMDGRVYRLNGGDILDILGFIGDVGAGGLY